MISAIATLLFISGAAISLWSIRRDISHILIVAGRAAEKRQFRKRLQKFGNIGTLRSADGRFASKKEFRLQQLRSGQ